MKCKATVRASVATSVSFLMMSEARADQWDLVSITASGNNHIVMVENPLTLETKTFTLEGAPVPFYQTSANVVDDGDDLLYVATNGNVLRHLTTSAAGEELAYVRVSDTGSLLVCTLDSDLYAQLEDPDALLSAVAYDYAESTSHWLPSLVRSALLGVAENGACPQ